GQSYNSLVQEEQQEARFYDSWVADDEEGAAERQRILDWLSTERGQQLVATLPTKDRELLESVKRHQANFSAVARDLGTDKTAVRQRLVGRRDSSGELVRKPGGGIKQAGILDRLGAAAVAQGFTL